jgi:hypothetical protein
MHARLGAAKPGGAGRQYSYLNWASDCAICAIVGPQNMVALYLDQDCEE